MNIKVSVIIPIYNMAAYLPECLDTVISQTLDELEILCINDGSTDNSEEIIRAYSQKDSRIVLISQENQGVGLTRNTGIRVAKGEYIAFMDPDDWYPYDYTLEHMYQKAKEHDALICGGSFSEQSADSLVTEFKGIKSGYQFKQEGLVKYRNYQFDYGFQRFLYKTSFLRENNIQFKYYIRFQDPPFFVQAMLTADEFYAMNEITYRYRVETQKLAWTLQRCMHYLMGLYDNVILASEHQLDTLYNLCLFRLDNSRIRFLEGKYDYLTYELVNLLLEILSAKTFQQIKENAESSNYYIEMFCFTHAGFYTNKDHWENISEKALKEIETKLFNIESQIYTTSDTGDKIVPELKSYYAISEYERRKHLKENKELHLLYGNQNVQDNPPDISVIVPIYNVGPYLSECLDSLISQTFANIEIICINDGSTDNSLAIALNYASNDERIYVYTQQNGGLSAARNAGIQHAAGKYVYFMDSDDILELNALELLYEKSEMLNLDVLYFDASSFTEEDNLQDQARAFSKSYTRKYSYNTGLYTGPQLLAEMKENEEYLAPAWMQFTRLEHFHNNQLWFINGLIHEDNYFTFKNLLTAKRAGYIHKPFFKRRVRSNSIMTQKTTFRNAYGYFISFIQMNQLLDSLNLEYREELAASEITYRILNSANFAFRKLTSAEKYAIMGMPYNERFLFKLYISDRNNLYTEIDTLKERLINSWNNNTQTYSRLQNAWDENKKLKKQLQVSLTEKKQLVEELQNYKNKNIFIQLYLKFSSLILK